MRKKLYTVAALTFVGLTLSFLFSSCKTKKSGCDAYGKINQVERQQQS